MGWIDIVGFAAASFVILAHGARQAEWLRTFAIAANVLFVAYGALVGLMPVLALHAILLPINLARLDELRGSPRDAPLSDLDRYRLETDFRMSVAGLRWRTR